MSSEKLSLRLVIDIKRNKVLYAEAGKDVVDFLFSILAMPVGTVVKLLNENNKDGIISGISQIYQSIEQLDEKYLQPNLQHNSLLDPVILSRVSVNTLFLPAPASVSVAKNYYRCANKYNHDCKNYFTETINALCPSCSNLMFTPIHFVVGNVDKTDQKSEGGGVVKGVVAYMIADNLTVTPMSTFSIIAFLNSFYIKDLGKLEEMDVNLSLEKGLELLKASLQSMTVLSDVFLGGDKH